MLHSESDDEIIRREESKEIMKKGRKDTKLKKVVHKDDHENYNKKKTLEMTMKKERKTIKLRKVLHC